MRKLLISLLIGLVPALPLCAAELKIGFVNTERIFRESPAAQKAQKKLEQDFSKRDQDIQKMTKQARDMQASLEKEGLTLAENDRNRRERELANLARDIQRAQREYREDMNLRKNEEFGAIQQKARKIILEIAEKEKYDLILENVVYASPRVDITDRVMKALDR